MSEHNSTCRPVTSDGNILYFQVNAITIPLCYNEYRKRNRKEDSVGCNLPRERVFIVKPRIRSKVVPT